MKKIRNVLFYLLKRLYESSIIINLLMILSPFFITCFFLRKKICENSFNKVQFNESDILTDSFVIPKANMIRMYSCLMFSFIQEDECTEK